MWAVWCSILILMAHSSCVFEESLAAVIESWGGQPVHELLHHRISHGLRGVATAIPGAHDADRFGASTGSTLAANAADAGLHHDHFTHSNQHGLHDNGVDDHGDIDHGDNDHGDNDHGVHEHGESATILSRTLSLDGVAPLMVATALLALPSTQFFSRILASSAVENSSHLLLARQSSPQVSRHCSAASLVHSLTCAPLAPPPRPLRSTLV